MFETDNSRRMFPYLFDYYMSSRVSSPEVFRIEVELLVLSQNTFFYLFICRLFNYFLAV